MNPVDAIAVVMPAYNEADGIAEFLAELDTAFTDAGIPIVIGIVDDCSTDRTREVAETAGASIASPVTVLVNDHNSGHGPTSTRAWRLGLSFGTETVVHVDGDGQFSGIDLVRVARAAQGVDGAVGVRTTRADPWFRRVVTATLRTYVALMIGTRIRDTNTPLRAYRSDRIRELLDALPSSPLVPSVYLSAASVCQDMDIVEIDVESRDRLGDTAVGSTWGKSALSFLPSKRLILFVLNAARESVTTLWSIRKGCRRYA